MHPFKGGSLALWICLLAAGCSTAPKPTSGDGLFALESVEAMDRTIHESSELLLRSQAPDGSWEGKVASTALAVQALAAVEPPVAAHAEAIEKGVHYLLEAKESGPDTYGLAYAVAAVTLRPMVDDTSGIISLRQTLRTRIQTGLHVSCTGFQRAVLLSALRKLGQTKDKLWPIAKALEKEAPASGACPDYIPEPKNEVVRALVHDILTYSIGGPGPGGSKRYFDDIIDQDEHQKAYPSGPLGLDDLLWASAGFAENRIRIIEPNRGCLFSGERLALRVLALRGRQGGWSGAGYGGDSFATATALMTLVNLRHVFETDVPYRRAAGSRFP